MNTGAISMTTHSEREAFEIFAKDRSWPVFRTGNTLLGSAEYEDTFVSCAWIAWQARASIRTTPHPTEVGEAVAYRGFFKMVEEMGELLTVLGKLGPFPGGNHPDGAGPLRPRIQDELADVMAAARYFAAEGNFNHTELDRRAAMKVVKFNERGLTGIGSADQVDVSPAPAAIDGHCGNCSADLVIKPWKYGGDAWQCSNGCAGSYGLVATASTSRGNL